jgi:hypothetical protein
MSKQSRGFPKSNRRLPRLGERTTFRDIYGRLFNCAQHIRAVLPLTRLWLFRPITPPC